MAQGEDEREKTLGGGEFFREFLKQGDLGGIDLVPGLRQVEENCAVNLGKRGDAPGMGRPFHSEGIAADLGGVTIAFKRPGMNELAAFLGDRGELDETAFGGEAQFFVEFSFRRRERLFPGQEFALGNGPGAGILVFPERPAGMDEQKLEQAFAQPIHQQTSAYFFFHL